MESWKNEIDGSWTLFLDRDGVINRKLPNDYVKHLSEFEFLPEVLKALKALSLRFETIVVVTNQQGIGKGLMTEEELLVIHQHMVAQVFEHDGRIDGIY
jgi:histidinol-phosphate phosphatase family protein